MSDKFKKKSFIKSIVLYSLMMVISLICKAWIFAIIFLGLVAINIWFQIRNKTKIDTNIISQGLYQIKRVKYKNKINAKKRKASYNDYLSKIESEFDENEKEIDDAIDEILSEENDDE